METFLRGRPVPGTPQKHCLALLLPLHCAALRMNSTVLATLTNNKYFFLIIFCLLFIHYARAVVGYRAGVFSLFTTLLITLHWCACTEHLFFTVRLCRVPVTATSTTSLWTFEIFIPEQTSITPCCRQYTTERERAIYPTYNIGIKKQETRGRTSKKRENEKACHRHRLRFFEGIFFSFSRRIITVVFSCTRLLASEKADRNNNRIEETNESIDP